MRSRFCVLVACLCTLTAAGPRVLAEGADDARAYMQAVAPGDEHAELSKLVGDWWVHGRMRMKAEEAWETLDAQAMMEMKLDGMHLQISLEAKPTERWPKPYRSERLLSFDTLEHRWQLVIADNLGTKILFAEGEAGDDPRRIRVARQLARQLAWPTAGEQGTEVVDWRAELVIESEDRILWQEYLERPGGEESLAIESVFSRKPDASTRLVGVWQGTDRGGNGMRFEFQQDSTVDWTISVKGAGDVPYSLRYTVDESQTPHKLDLISAKGGPMGGKTLYALIEPQDDGSIRLDLESGAPGSTGEGIRPKDLEQDDTVVFRRVE